MTTKNTTAITIKSLKKAIKADLKTINKIKHIHSDRYTIEQNEEIKQILVDFAEGCLCFLERWKDWGNEDLNLIEFKNDVYAIDGKHLNDGVGEVFSSMADFFELDHDQQDEVLNWLLFDEDSFTCEEDHLLNFSNYVTRDEDNLNYLTSGWLADEDCNVFVNYFKNTLSLRNSLITAV